MLSRALALSIALAACSSSSGDDTSGTADVSGTFGGSDFETADAIALVDGPSAQIFLSTSPDLCGDLETGTQRANSHILLIALADNQDGESLATGTYTTGDDTKGAVFESNVTSADCAVTFVPGPDGTGDGTITITDVSGGTVTGSFDMIMEDGAHVTGSFAPATCASIATKTSDPTCAP